MEDLEHEDPPRKIKYFSYGSPLMDLIKEVDDDFIRE